MDYVTQPNLKAPMTLNKYIGFTLDEVDLAGDIIIKALEKETEKSDARKVAVLMKEYLQSILEFP